MHSLGDLAGRFVRVLLIGLAPFAAPLDAQHVASTWGTMSAASAVIGALVLAVAIRHRARLGAGALGFVLVFACISALLFRRDAGPLARGIWFVAPFEWLALAALAYSFASRASRRTAIFAAAAVCLVGVASIAAAWPKIRSRDAMWSAALAQDPGDEPAALAVASTFDRAGRSRESLAILLRCTTANPSACACVTHAAARELTAGRIDDAVHLLDSRSHACGTAPGFAGLEADAWVRAGRREAGLHRAAEALARDPHDAHAMFAQAAAYFAEGNIPLAVRAAERADAAGYGDDATMLVGLIDLQSGDPATAGVSFRRVLQHQPDSVMATYDLALVADRMGRYHDAREQYLAALRLNPNLADARYNLAILTFRGGAVGEARHDLEIFERLAPNDPRLPELRAMLGVH